MTNELPIKATLKAGPGYDDPWLTVDAANPDDLKLKLEALGTSGALGSLVATASLLHGANRVGASVDSGVQAPAPASNGWGQPAQQQAAPAQQQQPSNGAQTHPEGLTCPLDNKLLEYGKTRTGKGQWKCPDYRWNNGNPNDHRLEWAN